TGARDAAERDLVTARLAQESAAEAAARLEAEIAELNLQLVRLNAALGAARIENSTLAGRIEDLEGRLNIALAERVEELERYRSAVFGRRREVIGENPQVRIVGDRFVFQSELLFASGSAELRPEARAQLEELGRSVRDLAATIPEDVEWVLRIDG